MLVLSRKLGESIRIGEDITITVVNVDRGKIRLGIEAPAEVKIMRTELIESDRTPGPTSVSPASVTAEQIARMTGCN